MAEDSFIREVNEEIRQERLAAFWRRYGPAPISAAIAVVLITVGFQIYSAWIERRAARIGDSFLAAVEMADNGQGDAALKQLDEVETSGVGAYPALARMRKASVEAGQGKRAAVVSLFDAVAADPSVPKILRDMASVRAAYILVDAGSVADVEKRVKPLATDIDPMRFAAREALGLAAWKAGNAEDAMYYFNKVYEDKDAASTAFFQRAGMMLNLIHSRETAKKAD